MTSKPPVRIGIRAPTNPIEIPKTRREFFKTGATLAGGLTLASGAALPALAEGGHDHTMAAGGHENESPMILGSAELVQYGSRSPFEKSVRIPHPAGSTASPDTFGKMFHIASPIGEFHGTITPSSLHYVATTRQSYMPEIDPAKHTLTIHGVVDRPLTWTLADLKRFPSVSRLHFLECSGNRHGPQNKNVQESHGMTSCAEWTGVLLSTLIKECGLKTSAKWFVAEGAEEVKGASSMPIAKAMDDVLVAYGMNGEAVRPQNGYPLRIVVPGFEGIFSTKYLRRIKIVDRYYMNYNDYGHLTETPTDAALRYQIGPKSIITRPSGSQTLAGPGFYEITGLAWSGGGAIKSVEVSTDGGASWKRAELKSAPQRMAHVRFSCPWNWDGKATSIMSRCTDEVGQKQPTLEQVAKYWNKPYVKGYTMPGLNNSVMPWTIAQDGRITNGLL